MGKEKNLAIIPARSGSKGLKDKNIKMMNGKPLLAYSIEAAATSGIFDEIFVSTDSHAYAQIAKQYGASVPFLRSDQAATDSASSWDVVRETIQNYQKMGLDFNMVSLLQPTTPLRTGEDIKNAYFIFKEKKANSVISVCNVEHSPLWCNVLPEDHSLSNFIKKEVSNLPRQELETYYRINGAIYMVLVNYFLNCHNIYASNSFAYIMEKERSVDIDDEFDFKLAEIICNMKESGKTL
jgi:CMP-N,N'-diacetyllegionaminic acid synthase